MVVLNTMALNCATHSINQNKLKQSNVISCNLLYISRFVGHNMLSLEQNFADGTSICVFLEGINCIYNQNSPKGQLAWSQQWVV